MARDSRRTTSIDSATSGIRIYRPAEASRLFAEKAARLAEEVMFNLEGAIAAADEAVRAEELPDDVVRELRDIHTHVRQRALGTSPQSRLV
jgi:citrate lyase beta subunit